MREQFQWTEFKPQTLDVIEAHRDEAAWRAAIAREKVMGDELAKLAKERR